MKALSLLCLLLTGCAGKPDQPRVRIANDSPGLQMWCLPLALADRLGYYKDERIDVDLQILRTRVTEALIGGSADVAALTYDSNIVLAAKGLIAAVVVLGILVLMNQLEGHLLQPQVVGKMVRLHPLAVILVLAVAGVVAGIAGAVVAVPITAAITSAVRALQRDDNDGRARTAGGVISG